MRIASSEGFWEDGVRGALKNPSAQLGIWQCVLGVLDTGQRDDPSLHLTWVTGGLCFQLGCHMEHFFWGSLGNQICVNSGENLSLGQIQVQNLPAS